jgi:hypothetical protein
MLLRRLDFLRAKMWAIKSFVAMIASQHEAARANLADTIELGVASMFSEIISLRRCRAYRRE